MLQEVLSDSTHPQWRAHPGLISPGTPPLCLFGGENVTKVTHLQTPEIAAWSHVQDMQRCHLKCWVKVFSRICDRKSFHLTVIVALSEYLLVICHEPASFLASVGLSDSGLKLRRHRLPYF